MTLTLNIDDPDIPDVISPAGDPEALKELGRMIVRRFYAAQTTDSDSDRGVPAGDGDGLYRRAVAAGGTTRKKNGN